MSSDAKWILGLILPALFVLAGMIQLSSHNTDQRIGRLEQRIERLVQRLDCIDQRLDRTERRLDNIDVRLARTH